MITSTWAKTVNGQTVNSQLVNGQTVNGQTVNDKKVHGVITACRYKHSNSTVHGAKQHKAKEYRLASKSVKQL